LFIDFKRLLGKNGIDERGSDLDKKFVRKVGEIKAVKS
jgi:hypothetical protein